MVTKSGFVFEIDADALDDVRVLEIVREMNDDQTKIVDLINRVLGKEQKEALYQHLEKIHGKASISELDKEVTEIFRLLKDNAKK